MAADFVPRADEIALDWRVLLFALGDGGPVERAVEPDAAVASRCVLSRRTRSATACATTAGVRSRRLSGSLVVGEIALAFTLLAVGALLIDDVRALERTSPGFETGHLLTFQLTLPDAIARQGRDPRSRTRSDSWTRWPPCLA